MTPLHRLRRGSLLEISRSLCIAGLLLAHGASLLAQAVPDGPLRFLYVEKFQCRFQLDITGSGTTSFEEIPIEYQVNRHAEFTCELEPEVNNNEFFGLWRGSIEGVSSVSIDDQLIIGPNDSGCYTQYNFDGAGAFQYFGFANASFQLNALGTELTPIFDLAGFLDILVRLQHYGGDNCGTHDETNPTQTDLFGISGPPLANCPTRPGFPISCLQFPAQGYRIEQSWDFDADGSLGPFGIPGLHHSMSLTLDGDGEDLEVVVTPVGYDDWLPEAKASELEEGNKITIQAKLQKKGGGAPTRKAEQFIFELTDYSEEPGVCLNYPVDGAKISPDLRFRRSNNTTNWMPFPDPGTTRIETTIGSYVDSPPAVLSSFDWGAYGTLKVFAVLEGGRLVEGHLEGDEAQKAIRFPKRDESSKIGDRWKRETTGASGKDDDDDAESLPAGDGHDGDGLTLYEEYRGFYMRATGPPGHVSGKPNRKDLFVNDRSASGAALERFRALSGLAVHHDLDEAYLHSSRVINKNHGQGPHVVDQHALIVDNAKLASDEAGEATGGPGLPRSVSMVLISDTLNPDAVRSLVRGGRTIARSEHLSTVVHEMLHACNVYHHGSSDRRVYWSSIEVQGVPESREDGLKPIQIYQEGSTGLLYPKQTVQVYLGTKGGQHSGVEDCVMRYDCSQAHTFNGTAAARYALAEQGELVGAGLCASKTGTGVNAPAGGKPWPRYGNATVGCCKLQICVNDLQAHAPDSTPTGCSAGAGAGDALEEDLAPGQGGAISSPLVFLSVNGSRAVEVYASDPVLFLSEIAAPEDLEPAGSLTIEAPGERWHKWLRLEARDSNGAVFAWPLHLATEGTESLLLDAENGGIAGWWTRPEETAALPAGEYEVRAVLDSSAAPSGWAGLVESAPVRILVGPVPSPAPVSLQLERLAQLARYYLVDGDLQKAGAAIDELLALEPESIAGLTLQGALLEADGKHSEAVETFGRAFELFDSSNPDAQEPPAELIRLLSSALAAADLFEEATGGPPNFRRGDSNGDGTLNLSDAIYTLGYLFLGSPTSLVCAKASDSDDTGQLNLSDAVFLLSYLFLGSREPPAPFPGCGADGTPDGLGCGVTHGCPQ